MVGGGSDGSDHLTGQAAGGERQIMVAVGVAENTNYQLVVQPYFGLLSPHQSKSEVPDFRTSRRRNLTIVRNVDFRERSVTK